MFFFLLDLLFTCLKVNGNVFFNKNLRFLVIDLNKFNNILTTYKPLIIPLEI